VAASEARRCFHKAVEGRGRNLTREEIERYLEIARLFISSRTCIFVKLERQIGTGEKGDDR